MLYIYVLSLKKNKYYIGKTQNLNKRYAQHLNGTASVWTRIFPVKFMLKYKEISDGFDEVSYVLRYMEKYGIENVRGGPWSSIFISENDQKLIRHQIMSSTDACFLCGKTGHYARNCGKKFCEICKEYYTGRHFLA